MGRPVIFSIISAVLILASCQKDEADEKIQPACEVEATLLDLSKYDGCRFVFQLDDGTKLEPYITDCIILGDGQRNVEPDPMMNFEMVDSKRVKISYRFLTDLNNEHQLSLCQAIPVVKITCITEVERPTTPQ